MSEKFLIDTNSFITPDKTYYAPDIAPSFWIQLAEVLKRKDEVAILDLVSRELLQGNDSLKIWFQNLMDKQEVKIISCVDQGIVTAYSSIMQYIDESPLYKEAALRNWAREGIADPWLIAAAKAYNYTIITFEKSPGPIIMPSKNPKIPSIAEHFGIKYEDLYYFMRHYSIQL